MQVQFYLKKLLSALLLPLPVVCIVLILGIICMLSSKQLMGKIFICLGLVGLMLFSLPFLPDYWLASLENRYPPLLNPPANIAFVVVLNGDQRIHPDLPVQDQLGASTMARLLEGIRLHQALPKSKLLLSGGVIFGRKAGALLMEEWALRLGVKPQDIILDTTSVNTEQQGEVIKKMITNQPFIVVTSANHLPRTMQIFARLGLHPLPAPCDYFSRPNPQSYGLDYLPDASNLQKSKAVIHEYLGMLWLKLNNKSISQTD